MTLLKAYSNKKDFEYYKKFCKEDVINTMVSEILLGFSFFLYCITSWIVQIFSRVWCFRVYQKFSS